MSETEKEDLATEKPADASEGAHALPAGPQPALATENPAGRIRPGMVLVLKGWCHLEDQEEQPGGRYPVFATAETAESWDDLIDDRSYGVVLSTEDARPASVDGFWTIRIAPVRKPETILVSDHGTEGVGSLRPGEVVVRHAQSSAVHPFADPLLGSDTLYVVASIPDGPWAGTREVVAHRVPKALNKDLVDALFYCPPAPETQEPVLNSPAATKLTERQEERAEEVDDPVGNEEAQGDGVIVEDEDGDIEDEIRRVTSEKAPPPATAEVPEDSEDAAPTQPEIDGCVRLLEVAATPEVPSRLVQVEAAKLLAHDVERGYGAEQVAATGAAERLLAFEDLDVRALGYLAGALADQGQRPDVARNLARSQKPARRVAAAFLLPDKEREFLAHDEDEQVRRAAKWAADPDRDRTVWRSRAHNYAEAVRATIMLAAKGDWPLPEAIDVLSSLWGIDSETVLDKGARRQWVASVEKAIEALELDSDARSLEPTDWEEANNPGPADKDLEDLWLPPAQREAMAKVIKEHCPGTAPSGPASAGPDQKGLRGGPPPAASSKPAKARVLKDSTDEIWPGGSRRPNMQKLAREMFPVEPMPEGARAIYDKDSGIAEGIAKDVETSRLLEEADESLRRSEGERDLFEGEGRMEPCPPESHLHVVPLPACDLCEEALTTRWHKYAIFHPRGRAASDVAALVGGHLRGSGECVHKINLTVQRACTVCGKFLKAMEQLEAIGNAVEAQGARTRPADLPEESTPARCGDAVEFRELGATGEPQQGNLGALGWPASETVLLDASKGASGGVAKHTLLIRRDWRRQDGVVLPVCEVATSRDLPPENLEDLWVATRSVIKGQRWPLHYVRAFNVADRPDGQPSVLDALDRSVLRDGLDWAEQFVGMGIYILEKDLEQRLSDPERWPQDDLAARDKVLKAMSRAHREIVAGLPIGPAVGPLTALAASWHNTTADVVAVDPQMMLSENLLLRLVPRGWEKLGDYRSVQRADLAVPFDLRGVFRTGEFRVATGDGLTARVGGQVVYLARVHAEGPLGPLDLGERVRRSRESSLAELRRAGVVVWEDPPAPDPEAEPPRGPVTPGPLSSLEVEAMEAAAGAGLSADAVSDLEQEAIDAVFALADRPARTMPELLRQLEELRLEPTGTVTREEDFRDLQRFDLGAGEAPEPEKSSS